MATPQTGIFKEGSNHFTFLEFRLKPNTSQEELISSIGKIEEQQLVSEVWSFGHLAWKKLNGEMPENFKSYNYLEGVNGYNMPSTQRDLFFWIHSSNESHNFDRSRKIINYLEEIAVCDINQTAFIYHDKRDFMGFVDGTGNPKTDELRYQAAVIPEGRKGDGGSIVFSQIWEHKLSKFEKRPIKEQEGIIGRTKVEDIELEGEAQPHNSHVSRTDLKIDGEAMKIWRRSAPYINGNKHGLFFLSFACATKRIETQLESMLGITEDKVNDRLMEFSTPVTGSYWFAPSQEELKSIIQKKS